MPGPLSATSISPKSPSRRVDSRSSRGGLTSCSACWALTIRFGHHLVELIALAPDRRQVLGQIPNDRDIRGSQPVAEQLERRVDQLVDVDRTPLHRARARHRKKGAHDPRAPIGGRADLFRTDLGCLVHGELVQQHRLPDDHRQGVVELVGDTREQGAERADLLALMQGLALPGDLGLRALLVGQVGEAGDDRRLTFILHQPRGQRCREHGAIGAPQHQLMAIQPALLPHEAEYLVAIARLDIVAREPLHRDLDVVQLKQLAKRGVDEQRRLVGQAGDDHRHRMALGDGPKALLARPERFRRPDPLADVAFDGDVVRQLPVWVMHGRDGRVLVQQPAVLVSTDQAPLPDLATLQRVMHLIEERSVVAVAAHELGGRPTQRLLASVAGQRREGRIDVDQPIFGVGELDRVAFLLHRCRQQREPLS